MQSQWLRVRAHRGIMLATVIGGSLGARPAGSPPPVQQFVAAPCPPAVQVPAGADPGALTCGYVQVPQNRADPKSKLAPVILPVAVYTAPSARSREPIVFLAGGPGESAIDVVMKMFLSSPVGQLLAREHPIVAYNQRGFGTTLTGTMPDLGMLPYQWRSTRDESVQSLVDTAKQAARRLRARGVDPKYFTTLHAVDDLPDVLRSLGYERAVLYATSYGTRIALRMMHRHPQLISAAVLDGVAPPQQTDIFDPQLLDERRRAVAERVVADCLASPMCRTEYGELEKYVTALARPGMPPRQVVLRLPSSGGWQSVELKGRDILSVIGAYASAEHVRAWLPALLDDLASSDTLRRTLSPHLVLSIVSANAMLRAAGPAYSVVYHSVVCGDAPNGAQQAGGRAVCDALGVPFGGDEATDPVTSDVPTLLLSAAYDAQTPPSMAESAARTLSKSHHTVFPGIGHVTYARPTAAACVAVTVHTFLLNPTIPPSDTCASAVIPSFHPRSTAGMP